MELVASIEEYTRGKKQLPTLPGVALKIIDTVHDEQSGLKELGDIIATDPPLSAKILKLVNSPFFGFPTKIGSVNHAINLLGTAAVKNLSLSFSLVETYRNGNVKSFDYSLFWKKSLISASACRLVAHTLKPDREEDLFFLGLIHNIGELALAQCSPDQYEEVIEDWKKNGCQIYEAESRMFDFNHMEIGEYLVRNWGLPQSFSSATRYHHLPGNLKTVDKEAVCFTHILHLASVCAELFYLPEKSLLLNHFNEYVEKNRLGDGIDLQPLLEQVYEQTLHIFPIFDITPESERQSLDLVKNLQQEISRAPSLMSTGAIEEGSAGAIPAVIEKSQSIGSVLVIDDEERNVELIEAMLATDDYQIRKALSGREALQIVERWSPDVILLDVMMPEMDGFEVCRRLKLNPQTRAIPILMVTALNKKEHRVRAMEAGADDFLNKPVDRTELLVRVRSLLRIKRYHDELLGSLEEIASQNQRLRELEKAKERLTYMIIHDLNNPLMAIMGNLELILLDPDDLTAGHKDTLTGCTGYCRDLKAMIDELLMIHQMENGKLALQKKRVDVTQLIDDLLGQFAARADTGGIRLSFEKPDCLPEIAIDGRLMKRVLANLIDNALRHTPSGGAVCVEVGFKSREKLLALNVRDDGSGLLPQDCKHIFDLYKQVDNQNNGTKNGAGGLGLAFCKMAVEAHNGKIRAESAGAGMGTAFCISMPT